MSSLESNKTMAMIGSILLIIGTLIPYGGAAVDIIGIILLLIAIKGFSIYYQDPGMYQNSFTGIIFYVIGSIAAAIGLGSLTISFASIFLFGLGLVIFVVFLIVAFLFLLLAAPRLRSTFYDLSQKTGEQSFHTAGTLFWWGAILTIVFFVGLVLIFVAWIFAAIGFFSMRTTEQQQYGQQAYGYTPPPPPTAQAARYCPNCGSPVEPNATYCPHCGKQLPSS